MNRPTDFRGLPAPSLLPDRPYDRPALLPTCADRSGGQLDRTTGGPPGRPDGTAGTTAQTPPQDADLRAELRERTADLQRVKAEYDNYRKRVYRDRQAVREIALANVLSRLLPVLDALADATAQGEMTGGFKRVTQALETELAALGLRSLGTAGDAFDPFVHEAASYSHTDQLDRPTCTAILRSGYRVGDHLLRPAQVVVAEPPPGP